MCYDPATNFCVFIVFLFQAKYLLFVVRPGTASSFEVIYLQFQPLLRFYHVKNINILPVITVLFDFSLYLD